jgi:uncharacterized protein
MMRIHPLLLAALFPMAGGCLSHRESRHIYSLEGAADAPARVEAALGRPSIQLERVLVPDYLDTRDISLRVGAHEIRESATGRFAERLSLGVTQALRSDLAAHLPQYTVAPAAAVDDKARRIVVDVDTFDVWPNGRCVLVAGWTILDADRRLVLSADRGSFTSAAAGVKPGDGSIVAAMADAVRQLAERIASTAATLPAPVSAR